MNPKIEKMARAMAVADGIDPDQIVPDEVTESGTCTYFPAWMAYQRQANLILAAMEAAR